MKMGIFAIFLLTFIVTLLSIFNIYLKKTAEEILTLAEESIIFTEAENYDKAKGNINKAVELWEKNEKIYELMTENSKLDVISGTLNESYTFFSQKRYEDYKSALSKLLFHLKHLIDENTLNSETIL